MVNPSKYCLFSCSYCFNICCCTLSDALSLLRLFVVFGVAVAFAVLFGVGVGFVVLKKNSQNKSQSFYALDLGQGFGVGTVSEVSHGDSMHEDCKGNHTDDVDGSVKADDNK